MGVDVGSPYNLAELIRLSHVTGGDASQLYFFDPRKLLNKPDFKEIINIMTVGIPESPHYMPHIIEPDLEEFFSTYPGRIIATDITPSAIPLPNFEFYENDLILIGNENHGLLPSSNLRLPVSFNSYLDKTLIVPMMGHAWDMPHNDHPRAYARGQVPNMNLTHAADIILFTGLSQLGYFDNFSILDLALKK